MAYIFIISLKASRADKIVNIIWPNPRKHVCLSKGQSNLTVLLVLSAYFTYLLLKKKRKGQTNEHTQYPKSASQKVVPKQGTHYTKQGSLWVKHNVSGQVLVKNERLDFKNLCNLGIIKPSLDLKWFQG